MAHRWNSVYAGLLDWASSVLGARVPSDFIRSTELAASFVDEPLLAYRRFVDDIVARFDEIPVAVAEGRQLHVEVALKLEIPPELVEAFTAEMRRLAAG